MKRYYNYLFRERRLIRFALFVVTLLIMLILGATIGFFKPYWVRIYDCINYTAIFNTDLLYIEGIVLLLLCILEPTLVFSFKMRRTSFENERTLPVSKKAIYLARFILGYVEIFLVFSFSHLVFSTICCITTKENVFLELLEFYIYILHFSVLAYSFFAFFFLRGRNIIDGFVLMALALVAMILMGNGLIYIVSSLVKNQISSFEYRLSPFSLFEWQILIYSEKIDLKEHLSYDYYIYAFVSILLLIPFLIFDIIYLKDFRVEDAQQKTVSIYGYKILIPITFISMMVTKNVIGTPAYYFVFPIGAVLTYLAYSLSYRRFIFNKKELYILLAVIGVELVFYLITMAL